MFFRKVYFYSCFRRCLDVFPEGLLFCVLVLRDVWMFFRKVRCFVCMFKRSLDVFRKVYFICFR
ncbi:unnamed protein product [Meloidogyne enterolobii]|uniref:Uncharacterized protein n=1 Tax=Meloidogyne enterolobii TaxID=390850 RepID=A0ACB1A5B9_MELEN